LHTYSSTKIFKVILVERAIYLNLTSFSLFLPIHEYFLFRHLKI
jgi:hypothetical protein